MESKNMTFSSPICLSIAGYETHGVNSSAEHAQGLAGSLRREGTRLRTVWSHNDMAQAKYLWGDCQADNDFCCCVCGWPIIRNDESVFPGETVGTHYPKWGRSSPEHELYASKGYRYVGLWWSVQKPSIAGIPLNNNRDPNYLNFLRKEMKWAHWYCNNVKNAVPVIKWEVGPDGNRRLVPWIENIMWIINSVWRGVQHIKGRMEIRFKDQPGVEVNYGGKKYDHLIHYFVSTKGPAGLSYNEKKINWKNSRLLSYINRLRDLIHNIENCVKALPGEGTFEKKLRPILDQRTRSPYGESEILDKWPPEKVVITETLPETCCTLERIDNGATEADWERDREQADMNDEDYEYSEEFELDDYHEKFNIPKNEAVWLRTNADFDVNSYSKPRKLAKLPFPSEAGGGGASSVLQQPHVAAGGFGLGGGGAGGASSVLAQPHDPAGGGGGAVAPITVKFKDRNYYEIPFESLKKEEQEKILPVISYFDKWKAMQQTGARAMSTGRYEYIFFRENENVLKRTDWMPPKMFLLIPKDRNINIRTFVKRNRKTRKRNRKNRKTRKV
jgi:hypothetical protein